LGRRDRVRGVLERCLNGNGDRTIGKRNNLVALAPWSSFVVVGQINPFGCSIAFDVDYRFANLRVNLSF
jgi:hypothetical protein